MPTEAMDKAMKAKAAAGKRVASKGRIRPMREAPETRAAAMARGALSARAITLAMAVPETSLGTREVQILTGIRTTMVVDNPTPWETIMTVALADKGKVSRKIMVRDITNLVAATRIGSPATRTEITKAGKGTT